MCHGPRCLWDARRTHNEKGVGDGLREALHTGIIKREDLFIQTKCVANILVWALALTALQHGFTPAKYQEVEPLPYDRSAPIGEQVAQNLRTSLKGVEYFDCVLLHIPYQKKEDTLETYRALEKAVNQGLIQHLGVSNIYDAEELEWLIANTKVEIEVVQNRWNDHTKWDWSVFEVCRSRGIQYQSFGFLKSEALVNDEHLLSLASKHKITPQQAIYKLCQVWGMTPLCGSTKTTHMREAFSVEGMTGIKADDDDVKKVWEDLHIGVLGSAAESEDARN
ncbi:hypothetical protein I316_06119 [Kwoniella heveanensis BCC8398]|uniref:NADP-dependent oxidoreductase domain-containing protein n=1 Tax=Kwoniella heveanensis BCC8398 TaxID=1296120 RepID=A0A1B9GMW7_9TREE|nr:hypothetical protein I316_06119 [Kwoniella heveanensis BCC8398]